MQVKRKSKSRRITFKTILVFLSIAVLAYLPLSSFMFFIKNDAFSGYFPSKYFISESINSNGFPWWNPYINFGLPQYGDMNSGFYSPFTWFIASLFRYTAHTFTIELLFYLFISGIGMYQLCRSYKFTKTVSYISGISFMCSGYMVGHIQHFNWISAAAFIPWCLWGYHQLINKFSLKNNIVCALLFYLFLSSAHPGLIIGGIYFFTAYIVFFYFNKKKTETETFSSKSFWKKNAWMFALLLILCIGMMVGYADIIPHITRGKKIESVSAIINPFSLQSFISLLLPMVTVKNDALFRTDISMRNMYFGLTLLLFLIPALRNKKNNNQLFFMYTGIFFLILSIGGIFKHILFPFLPLVNYVRLSGEFMIFAITSFILFSAFALNKFIVEETGFSKTRYQTFYFLQLGLLVLIAIGFAGILITHNGLFFNINDVMNKPMVAPLLKSLIDHLSFYDILVIEGIIQLGFLGALKKSLLNKRYKDLIKICALELILATLLNLPFTGVGQASVNDVDRALSKAREGVPVPFLTPIYQNKMGKTDQSEKLIGDWSFYNKQIGSLTKSFYPVELNTTKIIFKDSLSLFSVKPFIFSTNDSAIQSMKIVSFKGNAIDISLISNQNDTLVFQQNIYPHWNCIVNGEYKKPIIYAGVFNAVSIGPGKNFVNFSFSFGLYQRKYNTNKRNNSSSKSSRKKAIN